MTDQPPNIAPTDAELKLWLGYVTCPDAWLDIPPWQRHLAAIMSKNRNRGATLATLLVFGYLAARVALLLVGVPLMPIDILLIFILGYAIGILLNH